MLEECFGTLEEWFGQVILALDLVERSQVVESDGYIGVMRAKCHFTNSQGTPTEGFGLFVLTLFTAVLRSSLVLS
jgi:hypothetical protein